MSSFYFKYTELQAPHVTMTAKPFCFSNGSVEWMKKITKIESRPKKYRVTIFIYEASIFPHLFTISAPEQTVSGNEGNKG